MNLSTKQRNTHRCGEQASGCQGEVGLGRDGVGVWDQQMQIITCKIDKHQGPTVQHRKLYLIFHDELNRIYKCHFSIQVKLTQHCKSASVKILKTETSKGCCSLPLHPFLSPVGQTVGMMAGIALCHEGVLGNRGHAWLRRDVGP